MNSTASDLCAGGCGQSAPVIELLGQRITVRYCDECGDRVRREEEAAARARDDADALVRAGGTPRLLPLSLATFPAELGAQLAEAREWLEGYRGGDRRSLWLTGQVGSGKTGLAWGIVREVALDAVAQFWDADEEFRGERPNASALLLNWRDLLADLRAGYDALTGTAGAELYDRARRVALLALDDLGAERPTPWALEQLAGLVQARYDRCLPTIVTTNFFSDELAERLARDDTVVGLRIISRLLEGAVGIRFETPNRRRAA